MCTFLWFSQNSVQLNWLINFNFCGFPARKYLFYRFLYNAHDSNYQFFPARIFRNLDLKHWKRPLWVQSLYWNRIALFSSFSNADIPVLVGTSDWNFGYLFINPLTVLSKQQKPVKGPTIFRNLDLKVEKTHSLGTVVILQ